MIEADTLCDRIGDVLTITSQSSGCLAKLQELGYQPLPDPSDHSLDLLVTNGERLIPQLIESLSSSGIEVETVSLKKPTLDDVFLKYTGTRTGERNIWTAK